MRSKRKSAEQKAAERKRKQMLNGSATKSDALSLVGDSIKTPMKTSSSGNRIMATSNLRVSGQRIVKASKKNLGSVSNNKTLDEKNKQTVDETNKKTIEQTERKTTKKNEQSTGPLRDKIRSTLTPDIQKQIHTKLQQLSEPDYGKWEVRPVSYTHLTLPTICSV